MPQRYLHWIIAGSVVVIPRARRRRRRIQTWSVDHKVDHLLADARILQVDDLGRCQTVHHARIANLADDDLVADARPCERLDVRQAQRLALLDALDGSGAFARDPFALLLVHRVANDAARQCPDGATNQRAFTGMTALATDDGTGSRAKRRPPTRQSPYDPLRPRGSDNPIKRKPQPKAPAYSLFSSVFPPETSSSPTETPQQDKLFGR